MIRITIDRLAGGGTKRSHSDNLYTIRIQGSTNPDGDRAHLAFLEDGQGKVIGEYPVPYQGEDTLSLLAQVLEAVRIEGKAKQ